MENGSSKTPTSEAATTQPSIQVDSGKLDDILMAVLTELQGAMGGNEPMHSLHEAMGVIQEEFYEFQLEVYKNPRKHPDRKELAKKELIQLAAMSIRALYDVL